MAPNLSPAVLPSTEDFFQAAQPRGEAAPQGGQALLVNPQLSKAPPP